MSQEFEVLKLVCEGLEQAGIPYMLTGSLAAHFIENWIQKLELRQVYEKVKIHG